VRTACIAFPAMPPGEYALTFSLPDFHPATRDGVRVAFGATTSVSITLDVKPLQEQITVQGDVRILDKHATTIAARIDAETLADLPGTRTVGALLAATPALQLTRFDVGGNTAFGMGTMPPVLTDRCLFGSIRRSLCGKAPNATFWRLLCARHES
jgi:hypothetical protein